MSWLALWSLLGGSLLADPPQPRAEQAAAGAAADSSFLEQYAATYRFSLGRPTAFRVASRGQAVYFLRSGPRSFQRDLYRFDPATGRQTPLVDSEAILRGTQERLTPEERARRERMRSAARGIAGFELARDDDRLLIPLGGRLFVAGPDGQAPRELPEGPAPAVDARFSPSGRFVACVRDGELYVIDVDSGDQTRLTEGAGPHVSHGLAEFVAQEEMGRMEGYWWSPDDCFLAYQQTDTSNVEVVHLADPVHLEEPPQTWPYPRAGRNNAEVRLGVVSRQGGATVWIAWDYEAFPYLATVRWSNAAPLTLVVQNRAQTHLQVLAADHATGQTRLLLEERDPAWLNLDQQMPHWLDDGSGFFWTSEREGAWQLELHNRDGRLVHTVTPADFGYREFLGVDEAAGQAFVARWTDPTQIAIAAVAYKTSDGAVRMLADAPGLHSAVFARRGGAFVDAHWPRAGEPSITFHDPDGALRGALESVAELPPFEPRVEWHQVGPCGLRAALIRPRKPQGDGPLPVLVHVYGGPHVQLVAAAGRRYLLEQWFADQGFAVVLIDGRGTPGRGRAWERAIKGNLVELPLEDQVAGLRELARLAPDLDLKRVGIFGWSFGGYLAAMAVMRRPDVFHAAVAGAPVTDWRNYDTHYTERYLGLPGEAPQAYDHSSVLAAAEGLSRPLLLIHGTADDNVHLRHSLELSSLLLRLGKQHSFLPLSGFTHMVPEPAVTRRLQERIADFFAAHLGDDTNADGDRSGDGALPTSAARTAVQ